MAITNRTTSSPSEPRKYDALLKVVYVLALIGALNWGLVGFFNFNLVDAIFGGGSREITSLLSRVIYALVGVAGIIGLVLLPRLRYRHDTHATV